MSGGRESNDWYWSSVTEDTLLLHSDLLRLVDHIPLPLGVGTCTVEEDYGLPVLDGKTPTELSEIISRECGVKSTTYTSLMEYRLNALKELWYSLYSKEQKQLEKKSEDVTGSVTSSKSSSKGEGFASRVSLILIFPMLRSLSKLDTNISKETAKILLDSLKGCEPISLSKEPLDCILGLEDLLCTWLMDAKDETNFCEDQVQIAASALVALAVAVGTGGLLLRTVHMLQSLDSTHHDMTLLVSSVLHRLLREHLNHEETSVLLSEAHLQCWNYDCKHDNTAIESGTRSIFFDGSYIFVTSISRKRLLKLGTGISGTLRGYIYNSRDIDKSLLVYCKGRILYRELAADENHSLPFCRVLNKTTLQETRSVTCNMTHPESHNTIHLLSDGQLLYWIYMLKQQETATNAITGDKTKYHNVYLQILTLQEDNDAVTLIPQSNRILLQKATEDKTGGGDVVKALMRAGSSYASSVLGGGKDETGTSCGLGLKQLRNTAAYCTGSSLVIISQPLPIPGSRSLFGGASSNSKSLCVSLCYNILKGNLISQIELTPNSHLQCGLSKGGTVQSLAACYDYQNHCVWTVCEDWIDVWTCVGRVRPAAHILAVRMGHPSLDGLIPTQSTHPESQSIPIREAIRLLLRHSGVESCRLSPGKDFGSPVPHNLSLSFLEHCCDILEYSIANKQLDNALTCVITLQAVLPNYLTSKKYSTEEVTKLQDRVRVSVWDLLMHKECSSTILFEIRKLLSQNCEKLFLLDDQTSSKFISNLMSSEDEKLIKLRECVLIEIVKYLQNKSHLPTSIVKLTSLVAMCIEQESTAAMNQLKEGGDSVAMTIQPVFSPALQCGAAMLNSLLRSLSVVSRELKRLRKCEEQDGEKILELEEKLESERTKLITLCSELKLFEICVQFLECICELSSSLPSQSSTIDLDNSRDEPEDDKDTRQSLIVSLEQFSKGSALGCLLPSLLAVMSDAHICTLPMATTFLSHITNLESKCAECCSLLYTDHKSINVPAPWASGRVVETMHPVRDNYKFKETVSFPGARHLYLKFDSRCSSQYDYDKVIVFAGDTPSSTKVAEFGGNTHGFGSRSVLGKGWPKDLVKVDGDTVTFTFEMKSGREHSTPDKAMWGFSCTVRPQETVEDSPSGLPFLLDLYLSISSISCSLIGQLFAGVPPTPDEIKCASLMESSLLQKCVWPEDGIVVGGASSSHRKPLQTSILGKLRELSSKQRPVLRPTISELIQVDILEDAILSTCLKHSGIESPLALLGTNTSQDNILLLDNIFTRINGLERRLQALAELETRWWADIDDISSDVKEISSAFFYDLQQQESTAKQFELLCCLMSVELNSKDTYSAAKQLQELLEKEVQKKKDQKDLEVDIHSKTRSLVVGILDRAHLLLQVYIPWTDTPPIPVGVSRSFSVPAHFSTPASVNRQRSDGNMSLLIDTNTPGEGDGQSLLDEIFQFIGAKPEEAVSCEVFLSAASHQRQRGINRVRALGFLKTVLTSRHLNTTVEHLLACVSDVLRNGPCVKDISCSGYVSQVREAFADVMRAVVELASHQPSACINTISLLSIIPYTRNEESCLVKSGLVKLLDHLCSLSDLPQTSSGAVGGADNEGGGDEECEAIQRVTTLAWAAFQVLADRCVSWESHSVTGFISSSLAQQVSLLLTNHLSRAMDSLVTSESGTSETLQEALSMLLGLARTFMGRTILSQPACVSKLLLLLTDQRPSPKLVLIALQLCRIALPLMTLAECSQVSIPSHPTLSNMPASSNLASKIITLLMAKLAEYITPSNSNVRIKSEADINSIEETVSLVLPSQQDEIDESGQASVYLYRRDGDTASEILQLLINQDTRQLAQRMETVIRLDQSLTDDGKAEIYTDTYRACLRRSIRWANMGFTVSIEPPSSSSASEPSGTEADRRKAKSEATCKKKNMELLKTDPPRPFLSGTVAYSLASEIIALLNGLLADSDAAQVWKKAIQDVLHNALKSVPKCLPKLETYCSEVHKCIELCKTPPSPNEHLLPACLANATFAALGGFTDMLRPGMSVKLLGEGISETCYGIVNSISERRGIAHVRFEDDKYCFGVNQTLEVPISRLEPPQVGSLPLKLLSLEDSLCDSLVAVINTSTVTIGDVHNKMNASTESVGLCRLLAELRTRGSMCLAHHVKDKEFRDLFLSKCNIGLLQKQAEVAQHGQRLSVIQSHCMNLRMLYRDCSRPPAPKIERPRVQRKHYYLDISRPWPPVSHCSFSHHLTSLIYQGTTTSTGSSSTTASDEEGQDKPKGALILANAPVPSHAPSFYWEVELVQLQDSGTASLPHVTIGYCRPPTKPPEGQIWAYPEETCLFRNTGRGFQVRGEDRMLWNKLSIENPLKTGDIVGCGWLREEAELKGVVYFTVNGVRLEQVFKDSPNELFPFVHVQKKGIKLKVNFGDHPFAYQEGHAHRDVADIKQGESLEEIVELYNVLPFAEPDSDEEETAAATTNDGNEDEDTDGVKPEPIVVGPPCHSLELPSVTSPEVYDIKSAQVYFPNLSFNTMLESGPLIRPAGSGGKDQEEEEEEEGVGGASQEEDLHMLLVKAWESKVFPTIQRRFRNDQERKSGLDQIRGALQLGMESIAQETVEFLYEENGGLPRDLHFPTMDDIKADLDKFTISRVKKGSAVVIQKELPYTRCGIRAMQKTQGLTGIVLAIDEVNELVQVECYVPSDGALVRFWYPVIYLERPPKGYRKPSALRGADSVNILVHKVLLNCESILSSIFCRSALITVQSISSSLSFSMYFKLLALHYLSQPSVEGICSSTSPDLSPSLSNSLSTGAPDVFYTDVSLVEEKLKDWLIKHPNDSVPLVLTLSEEVCQGGGCSGRGEFPIPDGRESVDVFCPNSCFLVVSSVEIKPGSNSNACYKFPWAKVLLYRSGQGKSGRMILQEICRYPNEIPQSANPQYCGTVYPSLIVPTNRLHLKLFGQASPPGQMLVIHGVPSTVTLLMTVSTCLSNQIDQLCMNRSQAPQLCHALSSCLSPLISILCRTDWPPVVREKLFRSATDVLWTLSGVSDSAHCSPVSGDFSQALMDELKQMYERECERFIISDKVKSKGPQFPPAGSISRGGPGRFSTYLQSLLELVLSIQHYTSTHNFNKVSEREATPPQNGNKKHVKKSSSNIKNGAAKKHSTANTSWFNYIQRATGLLTTLSNRKPINKEFYRCFYKSLPSLPQSRLLVITGLSPGLEGTVAMETIRKICSGYGGLVGAGLYLPLREQTKQEMEEQERKLLEEKSITLRKSSASKPVEKEQVPSSDDDIAQSDTAGPLRPTEKKTSVHEEPKVSQATPISTVAVEPKQVVVGNAVIELNSSTKCSLVSTAILSSLILKGSENTLSVSCASDTLRCGDDQVANEVLSLYLYQKLFNGKSLKEEAKCVLTSIFNSTKTTTVSREYFNEDNHTESLLTLFLHGITNDNTTVKDVLSQWWHNKPDTAPLTVDMLLKWVTEHDRKDIRQIWSGILAAGYDLHFNRCGFLPSEAIASCIPDSAQDHALALHVDTMCRKLDVTSAALQPWDITITEAELTSSQLVPLQDVSFEDIRMRFIALKNINRQLSWLLPLVNLSSTHPRSLGALLTQISPLIFYDIKTSFLHTVLNVATRRSLDQAPPEIKMDPLQSVGGLPLTVLSTQFCQAARQMLSVPSPQLCVPLASGGDPTYAFNVKLSGEEVHGTSGSFRHFLWQVVRELQSPLLPILIQCPSSAAGINKGKHILMTGPMSYSEEKLLQFFGQLLGVAIRADVPVALDLLDCFWKSLKTEQLTLNDLKEADVITFSLTKRIIEARDEGALNELIRGTGTDSSMNESQSEDDSTTKFVYQNLRGEEQELIEGGANKVVRYENRNEYAEAVRRFRLNEMSCKERVGAIRCGLASVVPIEVLSIFTSSELDIRICGLPDVDLNYLKIHTTYHVGLMETDQHIQFFWTALESLSQEELRKFIKFACNQERIPFGQTCRSSEVTHVPPYPMKIAPPDGQGPPDSRYIRAETCMFLIKLPQYSTQEIMTDRLKYAINCREDPLSG